MEIINTDIDKYAHEKTKPSSDILQEIEQTTHAELEYDQMLSGKVEGRFLQFLVKFTAAKKILEIGMFTGYSALSMAEALPEGGHLITCDTNERYRAIAERFFLKSPHGKKIDIKMGPALETLDNLNEKFDMVFLDADKDNYPEYYEKIIPLLNINGLLIVDNVLWSGGVLTLSDRKSKSIDRLNTLILEDERVENVLLTIRDGINLVRKIRN